MNKIEFYRFGTKSHATLCKASPRDLKFRDNGTSDWWELSNGNFDNMTFPIIFDRLEGKKLRDVMETGTAVLYLISSKMKNILETNNLTGWKTFPVKVFDKNNNLVEGYHGFSIVGRSGPIDYNKSRIFFKQFVEGGPLVQHYKGEFIDPQTWDGSDFFKAEGYGATYVSSRAAAILKKSKISNIQLEKNSEVEIRESATR